ncbi:MAG: hydantoinase B/oxoprolinase family protein [Betaproteobacteria bacterium]|nr:hydantoinase B/oxoprolinase family protein [Betaproteobacteria bacterium]
MRRELRLLGEEATYSVLCDRAVVPPFGVGGGGSAAPFSVTIQDRGAEVAMTTPGKATGMMLRRDAVVVMQSAGGGGYGDPLARDPRLVAGDVDAGYVSAQRARADYGVALDPEGAVDEAGTTDLRRTLAAAMPALAIVADEACAPTRASGDATACCASRRNWQRSSGCAANNSWRSSADIRRPCGSG